MNYFLVFLGGGLGAAARHGVNVAALRLIGPAFPFGTLSINVAGSFVMGLLVEYFALRGNVPQPVRLFMTTGIVGGFTTFSTFSLEVVLLYQRGQFGAAFAYVASSVVLGVVALLGGMALVRVLSP